MSLPAIQQLIAKQALDRELLSHFISFDSGEVILRFESEYWDYKRELPDLRDSHQVAELAADILAFHNTKGGYIVHGITNDYAVLGVQPDRATELDSNRVNSSIQRYVGRSFFCRYASLTFPIGGTRKTVGVLFIPPRRGIGIPAAAIAPGKNPVFKEGDLFLRHNDSRKKAQTDSDFLTLYKEPEPDVIVGSHQLKTYIPRPGFRLFVGDYQTFVGQYTRTPLIERVLEELCGKWDVILLRGVGGVGKTAVATEATMRILNSPILKDHFGGIISLSAKQEQLTPYDIGRIEPEISSYEQFLKQIITNTTWIGDVPDDLAEKEKLATQLLKEHNILLFIDNFETIEVKESRFSKFLEGLPSGVKTIITSRHLPQHLPCLTLEVPPLDRREAEILALAEATTQRVDTATTDKFLNSILDISGHVPLAIKWIISCSKDADHLVQLVDDHRRGKPTLANLCEFCFTFEFNLLSPLARKTLALFPIFRWAPSTRELAVAADVDADQMASIVDELVDFSLLIPEYSANRDEEVFRVLKLTASFALSKLQEYGQLEREARRRLKDFYGASIPALLSAAQEMIARGATGAARQYIDEEILEREPTNATAIYLRGQTLEDEFQYAGAIKEYERALMHAASRPELCAEISLRLFSLSKRDAQTPREDLIPMLERAFAVSQDVKVGLEIARTYEMLDKKQRAYEIYQKLHSNYSPRYQDAWEEATVYMCHEIRETSGLKAAVDFVAQARRVCQESKLVAAAEKALLDEKVWKRGGRAGMS